MGRVVVVGLGPAGPELLTASVASAIDRIPHRFLRTGRHPAALAVPGARSFDDVYDAEASLDAVYRRIVEELVVAAGRRGEVLYAVPGSPWVAERTVELLGDDGRIELEVLPGMSFLDLAWARLGVDPLAAGVRLVDGRRFASEAAGERGPLLVAQCDRPEVLSEIKLSVDEPGSIDATVLQRLGLPDESVRTVPWDELDRVVGPDHLTSVYIPALVPPVAGALVGFSELVRELRQRCPWDREQTHRTLTRHLLEETYEVLEAIEGLADPGPAGEGSAGPDDGYDHLEEELGDLLFQVVFHATLAAEAGRFTLAEVARGIHEKLVRRHPHVFGEVQADTAGQVMRNWEQIKKAEKGRASLLDGIPGDLPSLLYAHKVQRKAASVGFDWSGPDEVWAKVSEELEEVRSAVVADGVAGGRATHAEVGDLLFTVVNLARHLNVDPEAALRGATAKFRRRFVALEELAGERGLELSGLGLPALDALWVEVKTSTDHR